LGIFLTSFLAWARGDVYSVRDFGAKGDGKTDDTAAFQQALGAAGKAGGGIVYAPRGNFFLLAISMFRRQSR
jgi:polygalacturonase